MGTVETSEQQPFTAAGKLTRALTALTNGALTFAGVGVFAGLFSLYGFADLRRRRVPSSGAGRWSRSASARWCS